MDDPDAAEPHTRWPGLAPWAVPGRGAVIAALSALGLLALWMAVDADAYLRPLDDANLVFHEAGHVVFRTFGDTASLYGGTLGQLVFPSVAMASFWWRGELLGCALAMAWFGQNLVNIARYVADARVQELPLVGGGEHDWFRILSRWSALDADLRVARWFQVAGWLVVLGAAAWLAWRVRMRRPG